MHLMSFLVRARKLCNRPTLEREWKAYREEKAAEQRPKCEGRVFKGRWEERKKRKGRRGRERQIQTNSRDSRHQTSERERESGMLEGLRNFWKSGSYQS